MRRISDEVTISIDDLTDLVRAAHTWIDYGYNEVGIRLDGRCACGRRTMADHHIHVSNEVAAALRGDLTSIPRHRTAQD